MPSYAQMTPNGLGDVMGDIVNYLDTSFWPIVLIVGIPVALVVWLMRRPTGARISPRDEPTSLARPGSPLQEAERAARVQDRREALAKEHDSGQDLAP